MKPRKPPRNETPLQAMQRERDLWASRYHELALVLAGQRSSLATEDTTVTDGTVSVLPSSPGSVIPIMPAEVMLVIGETT